jgi:hypothetical protein
MVRWGHVHIQGPTDVTGWRRNQGQDFGRLNGALVLLFFVGLWSAYNFVLTGAHDPTDWAIITATLLGGAVLMTLLLLWVPLGRVREYNLRTENLGVRHGMGKMVMEALVPWSDIYIAVKAGKKYVLAFSLPGDPPPRSITWAGREVANFSKPIRDIEISAKEWEQVRQWLSPKVLEELEWRKNHSLVPQRGAKRS